MNNIGLYLLIICAILIIIKMLITKNDIKADNGSVAIGKSNYGDIRVTNKTSNPKDNSFWNAWNIGIGIIGIVGFMLTLWPLLK